MKISSFALFLLLLFSFAAFAQQYPEGVSQKNLQVKSATSTITLDGVLDESTWLEAEKADKFHQKFPYDTSLARLKTEVMVSFDDKFLYIAAINYHREGQGRNQYILNTLKRDFGVEQNDHFMVHMDTYNDGTNGFSFGVNASGAQREGLISNGGSFGNGSMDWDNKWYSAVQSYDDRYVVEMAIPLKTIRYNEGVSSLKFNFQRVDWASNEESVWNWVPRNFNAANLAYTGKVDFDKPIKKAGLNASVIPYVSAGINKDYNSGKANKDLGIGGDAKIAVTSSLNLDLTYNPDFSQTEVDRQVTNLSRFELFFPERRQFFLENSDLFSTFGFSKIRPFFSRRIGLVYSDQKKTFVEDPIIYGARLSGKLNRNWRVGLMNMQTQGQNDLGLDGKNYTVAAVQRKVFARSNIGVIFVNQQTMQDTTGDFTFNSNNYNRVMGLDYNLASADGRWTGKFFYHQALSPGVSSDQYAHASYLGYNVPKFGFNWNHEYVGENYDVKTGFQPRSGYWRLEPSIRYTFFPKSSKINNLTYNLYNDQFYNKNWKLTDNFISNGMEVNFQNTSYAELNVNYQYYYFADSINPLNVGEVKLNDSSSYQYVQVYAGYTSDIRKKITLDAGGSIGSYYNGNRVYGRTFVGYRYQPYGILGVEGSYNYIKLAAPFKQVDLILIGPRIDISFSKSLFFSTVVQYNNQIKNVNLNARLQWRFAPVSDLFIVYQDNYTSDSFIVQNRGLVMKLTYWL